MSCITEILKLKGDKEVFLPLDDEGKPWIAVEGGGIYREHEYLIVLNTIGHRCGYVALKPNHPFNNVGMIKSSFLNREEERLDYDKVDISCHGGLTFMSSTHSLKSLLTVPCTDVWIGFDCGHYLDNSDIDAMAKYYGKDIAESRKKYLFGDGEGSTIKTYGYAENECHKIIDQCIDKAAA